MKKNTVFILLIIISILLSLSSCDTATAIKNTEIKPNQQQTPKEEVATVDDEKETIVIEDTPSPLPNVEVPVLETPVEPTDTDKPIKEKDTKQYSMKQATSDRGQLNTIAFSGLAFITGTAGADSFFPPGKVADFFGFQYMRDNDTNGLGHNTTFLTIAAANVISILDENQMSKLTELAEKQESLFENFAMSRFPIMVSFRNYMEETLPENTTLNKDAVAEYTSSLYEIDASLSYERAIVLGEIITSFTDEQKAYFEKLDFHDSSTWPIIDEKTLSLNKKGISHTEKVAIMTYASELFSWYLGNSDADAYFCPERHGTYFGGFYMKDYHAMGNPDYFISTTVTGDSGEEFLNILTDEQRILITSIIEEQKDSLNRIVEIRYLVSEELRKAALGESVNRDLVFDLIKEYGYLDGEMSYMYANAFANIKKTLSEDQLSKFYALRNLDIYPDGAFMFSAPIDMPVIPDSNLLYR